MAICSKFSLEYVLVLIFATYPHNSHTKYRYAHKKIFTPALGMGDEPSPRGPSHRRGVTGGGLEPQSSCPSARCSPARSVKE